MDVDSQNTAASSAAGCTQSESSVPTSRNPWLSRRPPAALDTTGRHSSSSRSMTASRLRRRTPASSMTGMAAPALSMRPWQHGSAVAAPACSMMAVAARAHSMRPWQHGGAVAVAAPACSMMAVVAPHHNMTAMAARLRRRSSPCCIVFMCRRRPSQHQLHRLLRSISSGHDRPLTQQTRYRRPRPRNSGELQPAAS